MKMSEEELAAAFCRLLAFVDKADEIAALVRKVKPHLVESTLEGRLSERDFYRISSLLTSQARSPLCEKYYIKKRGFRAVGSQEDRGDFVDNAGEYVEYKMSAQNEDNALHVVQIRPWQKVRYVVQKITAERVFTFHLTHEQMSKELKKLKASVAHGAKKAAIANQNVEYRFTIEIGGEDWKRWISKYLTKDD